MLDEAGGVIRRVVHRAPPPVPDDGRARRRLRRAHVGHVARRHLRRRRALHPRRSDASAPSCSRSSARRTRRSSASGCSPRCAGGTAREYCRLAFDLGDWLADAAVAVLAEAGVPRTDVRAIGSHGQTIWHEPGHSTWQIGEAGGHRRANGHRRRERLPRARRRRGRAGRAARSDRRRDAVRRRRLARAAEHRRHRQRDGRAARRHDRRRARVRHRAGCFGDRRGGARARCRRRATTSTARSRRAARRSPRWSTSCSRIRTSPPAAEVAPAASCSTRAYVDRFIERCRARDRDCSAEDIVATATALTARSIADAYRRFMPEPVTEVLLSGGGAKNPTLRRDDRGAARADRGARVRRACTSTARRRKRWPSRCSRCCTSRSRAGNVPRRRARAALASSGS